MRDDDIEYLEFKMSEVDWEDLKKTDISCIQQEMAFFIINAEVSDENMKLLKNLDHAQILEIA